MTAFAPDQPGVEVRVSPNFGERRGAARPDILLLHYTGMETGTAAEDRLCSPASEVSCHYLVHEDGRTVQMVREQDRAWHAGKSFWQGDIDINSRSVGIEIVNPGHAFGYRDFPPVQIAAVIGLCRGIIARHGIPAERVLAHSDVAPGRKLDPGEKFPWRELARAGVGHWVEPAALAEGSPECSRSEVEALQNMLVRYGYGLEASGVSDGQTRTVVEAFQRHFRPERVDGVPDPSTLETLRRLLAALPGNAAPESV